MADRSSTSHSRDQSSSTQGLDIEQALDEIMDVDGAIGTAIVDYNNGMTIGTRGDDIDMELAGASNTQFVSSKNDILYDLGLEDQEIEDILISLTDQYHLIRISDSLDDVFIYLAIDRNEGNLGLARRKIDEIAGKLEL
jgi:predicted regulator of Ras-like GTPase activity (Roadblock/LC7/MglB family)